MRPNAELPPPACRLGEALAAGPDVVPNNFVIGVASRTVRDEASPAHPSTSARGAALHAGWLLESTVAQGDCGVDVMAYHLGLERTQPSWDLIRSSIVDFPTERAREAA